MRMYTAKALGALEAARYDDSSSVISMPMCGQKWLFGTYTAESCTDMAEIRGGKWAASIRCNDHDH